MEADSARLRERRSMMGSARRRCANGSRTGGSSEALSGSEEGAGCWAAASGSSMRKETEARISASVEGFFILGTRRAAGGRRFPLSGTDS